MMNACGTDALDGVVDVYAPRRLPRKMVRHRCGYPLVAEPVFLPWEGMAVVSYRSALPDVPSLLVFCCPGCEKPLKLWWEVTCGP